MRKIHFYGRLKQLFPKPISLDVETPGEAIRAISMQSKAFIDMLKEGSYQIIVGKNRKSGLTLELEDINGFRMGRSDLHIVPVIAGSRSKGGIVKTILGTAIIGAAIFMSGGTLAAPLAASGLASGITWGNVAMIGATIALAGISQLVTKPASTKEDDQNSFSLSGPATTYTQGNPVPLVYGGVITGGVLISGGIDIEKIAV